MIERFAGPGIGAALLGILRAPLWKLEEWKPAWAACWSYYVGLFAAV